MRTLEQLEASLGELSDESLLAANFSDAAMRKVAAALEGAVERDEAWEELLVQFPEVSISKGLSSEMTQLLSVAETIIQSLEEGGTGSPGEEKTGSEESEGGAYVFGPDAVGGVGRIVQIEQVAKDLPAVAEQTSEMTKPLWVSLVRPVTAQVIDELTRRAERGFSESVESIVLDGEKGAGKSVVLAQAGQWARAQGWLVVSLDGIAMTRGGRIVRNKNEPHLWDQQATSRVVLEQLLEAEGEALKTMPVKVPHGMPLRGAPIKLETLHDLVRLGATSEENSTPVLIWLRTELSLVTERPVLIVIDNVNALHCPSSYFDMDSKSFAPVPLSVSKLAGPRLFLDHHCQFLSRGTSLVATTRRGGIPTKSFDAFDGKNNKNRLEVPKFSLAEFNKLLEKYGRMGLAPDNLTEDTRKYLYTWTAGNVGDLRSFVNYL